MTNGRMVGAAALWAIVALFVTAPGAGAVAPRVQDVCGGLVPLDVAGVTLCTHGPDQAPAARAGTAAGTGGALPQRVVTCIGDGQSGQRVQVLYVHGSAHGPASSSLRSDITRWVEQVDWTVWASAQEHGGDRRVRWQTAGCEVEITSERVSNTALTDFSEMIHELRERGYRRGDRSYLLFVQAETYCGIGTAPRDDRPTDNRADRIAGYARVDAGCWDTGDRGYHSIAAHELVHTLGGVQESAPHSTPGAHCTDDHDLMCYDDGTGDEVRTVCRDGDSSTHGAGDAFDRLLDCRGDDYFNPSPPSGSYLDTHWNTADSARLHDPTATPPDDGGDDEAAEESSGSSTGDRPPSPTGNPVGYLWWIVFG